MWFCLHSPTLVEPVKDIADIFGLLHIVRPMAEAFSLEAVITFITPNQIIKSFTTLQLRFHDIIVDR